jgi:alpha-L-fucosidase
MVGATPEYLEWFINDLPKTFYPDRWDAEEIARIAKLCGMQYVVLTAKHHSGFCLWDTETTDFKITNTPYGKDILQGYVEALRKYGIQVGLYYSPEDFAWLHRNGFSVRRRGDDLLNPDEHSAYKAFVKQQVTEMFSNYGKIDVLFIDGIGEEITKETCWSLQPDCLITRGSIETPEQFVPGRPPEGPWEANLTMGTQWQYKPTNDDYKSGTRMIEILIETRAKGGSLLLNIGPKPNGELPIEQEARLRELALWYAVNNEAIHSTRPWLVAREENIWFTKQKDADTVYAFITGTPDWPRGQRREFVLQSVKATPNTKVGVLGHAGKWAEYAPTLDVTPRFQQTDDGLEISVTRSQRLYNNHKWHNPLVVKLENVKPALELPPYAETVSATPDGSGAAVFEGKLVELAGADRVEVGFEYQEYLGFAEAMYNTEWTATPRQRLTAPGAFRVKIRGLKAGQEYQYRAVVAHPQLTVRGDHKRITAK